MKKIGLTHKLKASLVFGSFPGLRMNVSVKQPTLDNDISVVCVHLCFSKCPGP